MGDTDVEAGGGSGSQRNTLSSAASVAGLRLRKPERKQMGMLWGCPDDLVDEDHQVRTVALVVARLDLSGYYAKIKASEGGVGRDATDPALLVSLWLYGCIRGIGSARELARRCLESAPFKWLCGGVGVNHRLLSEFRVKHAEALDDLFTQVLASLVEQGLVKVGRISQDGLRVRASAGSGSFRRERRLEELLEKARAHVAELRRQLDDPQYAAAVGAGKAAARKRAAAEKVDRLEKALEQLPRLKQKREKAAERKGGKEGKKIRDTEPRVSSTDPEARVMKMPNGGFNPAYNVQLAADTHGRAVVGVEVSNEGSDSSGLSEPMRKQVEARTGRDVEQHLMDGGYLKSEDLERAGEEGVELFVPPHRAINPKNRGKELEPRPTDSPAALEWKKRMSSEEGKKIYKERAATSETVNADVRCFRGLVQLTVRGLKKGRCVALWCGLAYNLMHFGAALCA
jgi:transposase